MNGVQKAKYLTSNDAEIREKVIMVQKEVGKYDYFFEILGDIVAGSPDKPVIKVLLLTRYGQSKYEDGFFGMLRGHCPKEGKSKSSGEDGSGDRYVFTYGEQVVEVTHLTSHKSK